MNKVVRDCSEIGLINKCRHEVLDGLNTGLEGKEKCGEMLKAIVSLLIVAAISFLVSTSPKFIGAYYGPLGTIFDPRLRAWGRCRYCI